MSDQKTPGTGGDHYISYEERTGGESTVYFTKDLSAEGLHNIFQKVGGHLTGKVAVKLHTGEKHGPNIIPRPWVESLIKNDIPNGNIVETNTYYEGDRYTTEAHRETLKVNGWTFCPVDIMDEDGTALFPIKGGKWFKEMSVGKNLANYDSFLALTHFKGHESTGFGGAIKNIGMGGGSRAGKMEQHSAGKPYVNKRLCVGCGMCTRVCAHDAITIDERKAQINHDKCVGCGRCVGVCPKDAVTPGLSESNDILNCKMAEYTLAICKDRPCFHISLICDVSPNCDCHPENDRPIIPNVGMLASFDPVALDMACADLCNQQPVLSNSVLAENIEQHKHEHGECDCGHGHDHFYFTHPDTNWRSCIEHAVKIGLGTDQYELIEV